MPGEKITTEILLGIVEDLGLPRDTPPDELNEAISAEVVARGYKMPALSEAKRIERELGQALAERAARKLVLKLATELSDLLERLEAMEDDMSTEYRALLGRVIGLENEIIRVYTDAGLGDEAEDLIEAQHRDRVVEGYRALSDLLNEESRAARLARRRESRPHEIEAASVGGRVCSACGRKPARVDDLCKPCAKQAGTLPSGKI